MLEYLDKRYTEQELAQELRKVLFEVFN